MVNDLWPLRDGIALLAKNKLVLDVWVNVAWGCGGGVECWRLLAASAIRQGVWN